MDVFEDARESARALFEKLDQKGQIIVLAESCTGGLVSALLAANPGVSRCLAGSWVTYQDSTKTGWLGVDSGLVREKSSVSAEVTQAMARCALERTPGAGVSLAVTGHLEPENSPNGPFAHVAMCYRKGGHVICNKPHRFPLPEGSRVERQYRAVWHALQAARDCIDTNA
jgi:nicotinamide-nucleotide amidase